MHNSYKLAAAITIAFSSFSALSEDSKAVQATVADSKPIVEKLVDDLTTLSNGPYKGQRAAHAKGALVMGSFIAAPNAAGLSKASIFAAGKTTPIIVRYSNNTGIPDIADADANATPRGIAIRYMIDDSSSTDMVMISAKHFPVATPEEFLTMLDAVIASGKTSVSPKPTETFLSTHPAAKAFVAAPKRNAVSFATQGFNGINAFKMTNAAGVNTYIRYRIEPINGEQFLSDKQAGKASPNYLYDSLPKQLAKKPIKYTLYAQLATDKDNVNDPSIAWSKTNKKVKLGTLVIEKMHPDAANYQKANMFNPLDLVDGISASDDKILAARPAAYAVSFGRRMK